MKKLLLSTALLGAFAAPSLAQTADIGPFHVQSASGEILASDLIGARIYTSETALAGESVSGRQQDWEDIGEVNDAVLSFNGSVQAVLVDIGGFLGMGERQVAVPLASLRMLRDDATADVADDYFLVLTTSRAALETAPAWREADMTAAPVEATGVQPMAADRTGYGPAAPEMLTADNLTAADVYDASNNRVGAVADLVLDSDGKITQVIVDVGGFLGIGEKRVALPIKDIEILSAAGSGKLRVFVPHSQDQLEALPVFKTEG